MSAMPAPPEKFRPNPKLKWRERLEEVLRFKHLAHPMANPKGAF